MSVICQRHHRGIISCWLFRVLDVHTAPHLENTFTRSPLGSKDISMPLQPS